MNDIFKDRKFAGPAIRNQVQFHCPKIYNVSCGENSLRYLGTKMTKNLTTIKSFKDAIKAWTPAKYPCKSCKPYVQGLGYVSLVDYLERKSEI